MKIEEKIAYELGGYREKYAMDNGTRETQIMNGKEVWVYRYDTEREYQDANGATYIPTERRWIG